jgi:lysophospholipase
VTMPVFIVATTADRLVGVQAIRRAARLLPDAQCLWFGPEAAHEVLREAEPVRLLALDGIDRFLDRVCPA